MESLQHKNTAVVTITLAGKRGGEVVNVSVQIRAQIMLRFKINKETHDCIHVLLRLVVQWIIVPYLSHSSAHKKADSGHMQNLDVGHTGDCKLMVQTGRCARPRVPLPYHHHSYAGICHFQNLKLSITRELGSCAL